MVETEQQVWEHGYKAGYCAGREDFGALVIASMIEAGQAFISLNEFRDIILDKTNLPKEFLSEDVAYVLDQMKSDNA